MPGSESLYGMLLLIVKTSNDERTATAAATLASLLKERKSNFQPA
jgi:hypothetical protein